MVASTRRRLVDSAMALFAEQGFEATSVEDVAAHAGVGRTTFFRHFPTKEDVVFPDHDALLDRVDARLATGTAATARTALEEASRIVLAHYLDEGETARQRYRLTRSVTQLRHRELASVHRYVRLFSGHVRAWLGDREDAALRSELTAAAVITAHNHVLRGWLRGELDDPRASLTSALDQALAPFSGTPADIDEVLAEVRRALERR
ncbi:TetR/AcrR family transcriptional regulator [Nocardioides pyridinolyticus]